MSSIRFAHRARAAAAIVCAALASGGCATFSEDGGFATVAAASREKLGKEVRWARTEEERGRSDVEVARLLSHPLSADDAVQVALLSNPALQASFEELGLSEADLVASSRLPNPALTLRHTGGQGHVDVEQVLTFDVLALAAAPFARDIEKRRFAQAQARAALSVARLAARTRRAYFVAVAAAESLRYLEQVRSAAESGAELARRMQAAGNWSAIDASRERSFHVDAMQGLAAARLADASAREQLRRLLGLDGDGPALADRLPDLPASAQQLPAPDSNLLSDRIDLRMQRQGVDALAHALGLTRATRFIHVLEAGPARVREGADSPPYEHGYEIVFEVPIFDGGAPRRRRAAASYSQAVDRYAQAAIDARSEVRAASAAYRAAFEIAALQRDEAAPRARAVAAEELKRYNASLVSVFDLLAVARAQIGSVEACIRALRDFWIAKSELDAALLGGDSHVDP